jgi:ribonuclease E
LQNGSHEPGEPDSFAPTDESSAGAAEWSDSAPEAPADELTAARHEPEPSPYPQEQRAEPAAAPTSEPRRRSTVREAAPVSFQPSAEPVAPPAEQPPAQPMPAPVQPGVVSGSTEDESKPRRSGWWSRRG